jgi:hypothetical protein
MAIASVARTCERVLMIAWRIWFARNEVSHDKELPLIVGSRRFLCSYMHSLENIKHATTEQIIKGKQIAGQDEPVESLVRVAPQVVWRRPQEGELKLNVDGAFVAQTLEAAAGMIMRRSDGTIVFSTCRVLSN